MAIAARYSLLYRNPRFSFDRAQDDVYGCFPFSFVLLLPGSQHFAAAGEIELACHRIQQPAAELNWSQQPLQCYGVRTSHFGYHAIVPLAPVFLLQRTWQML